MKTNTRQARLIVAAYALALLAATGSLDAMVDKAGVSPSDPWPPLLLGLGLGTLWHQWKRYRHRHQRDS